MKPGHFDLRPVYHHLAAKKIDAAQWRLCAEGMQEEDSAAPISKRYGAAVEASTASPRISSVRRAFRAENSGLVLIV